MLNLRGEIIGVARGQFYRDAQSLNFTVPVTAVQALLEGEMQRHASRYRSEAKPLERSEGWADSNCQACAKAYTAGHYAEALERIKPAWIK